MDCICLYGESVSVDVVGVFHSNKARYNRYFAFRCKNESTLLHRLRLAVVPPHALLRINKHKVSSLEQIVNRSHKLVHGAVIRTQRKRIAVAHENSVESRDARVVSFLNDAEETSVFNVFMNLIIDKLYCKTVTRIEMIACHNRTGLESFDILKSLDISDDKMLLSHLCFYKIACKTEC